MQKIEIVIAHEDKDYVKNISVYISENYSSVITIFGFSDKEKFYSFIRENLVKIDILMISPDMIDNNCIQDFGGALMVLTDEERQYDEFAEFKCVSRYISADNLVKNIIQFHLQSGGKNISVHNKSRCKMYSFYSADGGAGSSSVCFGAAHKAANKGYKTLYLNMEVVSMIHKLLKKDDGINLSNVFYHIKSKKENLRLVVEASKRMDENTGLLYFHPPQCGFELCDLNSHEYCEFIEAITEQNESENLESLVFVDLPGEIRYNMMPFLTHAKKICMVSKRDMFSMQKRMLMLDELDMLKDSKGLDFGGKIVYVNNDVNDVANNVVNDLENNVVNKNTSGKKRLREDSLAMANDNGLIVPYVKPLYTWVDGSLRMNIDNGFGDAMDSLVEKLTKVGDES